MARVMMQLYFALRFLQIVTPWVVRPIMSVINLMLMVLSSIWVGIPQAVDRIANETVRRATDAGVPTIWNRQLFYAVKVVAFLTIVLGWIFISFVTVWILRLVF